MLRLSNSKYCLVEKNAKIARSLSDLSSDLSEVFQCIILISDGNRRARIGQPDCRAGTVFKIEFEDGSSATLCLADPGSSVAVRDKNNAVEYLG